MASSGISVLDLVISTLNRLSGIPQEPADSEEQLQSADLSQRPNTERLKRNDLYYMVSQHSGQLQRKRHRNLLRCIDERSTLPSVRLSDRCYIGCQVLPNRKNNENMLKYQDKAFCGTFENNGEMFMATAQDCKVRIYETRQRQLKCRKSIFATNVGWSILDTSVSPDGRHFVYSSWSESLRLCHVDGTSEDSLCLDLDPQDNRFCVFAVRFSADGEEVLCGASDTCLYVYNLVTRRRTLQIPAHDDEVNTVCFADRSSHILFTGGDDGVVKVWDRRVLNELDPKPVGMLSGHRNGVTFIDSKGDGRYLISNSKDQTIKLWDIRCFADKAGVKATHDAVYAQNWDYRWQPVPQSQLNLPPLPGDVSVMTYRGHNVLQTLIRCRFSPMFTTGQRYIYTGCSSGRVQIYDILTGRIKRTLSGHRACVRDVSWHPYEPVLRSTSFDTTIKEWVYRSENPTNHCDFDPDVDVNMDLRPRSRRLNFIL